MRLIDTQKSELNKKGIYEDVRPDIQKTQTLHSAKNLSGGSPLENEPLNQKKYDANHHHYHEMNNSARMPTHNYQTHFKNLCGKPEHRARLQNTEEQAED